MRRSNSKHALDNVSKSSRRPPDTGHEAPGAADRARPKILIVRIGDKPGPGILELGRLHFLQGRLPVAASIQRRPSAIHNSEGPYAAE